MNITARIVGATALLILSTTVTRAEGYVGGAIGSTAMVPTVAEDSINQWNAVVWGPGNDCDTLGCYSDQTSSGGLKLFAGYRVNPYFAAEGFIAYLGSFEAYASDGWGVDAYTTADVSTLGIAAVGLIPLGSGKVSLLGKLGLHSWSAEGTVDLWDTVAVDGVMGTYSTSGIDGMGGIGVHIDFGERAAMRVEFEYFAANTDYSEIGVGLLSVGGMFRF